MTSKDRKKIFAERKNMFGDSIRKQKRKLSIISFLRLAAVIMVIYFIVLGVKTESSLPWVVSGLMTVLFFSLVAYHKNATDKKNLLQNLIDINDKELNCLDRKFSDNPDGKEFLNRDHAWSYDLDIFGEGSLFQYINRTATHQGPELLAASLTTVAEKDEKILSKQEKIKEFAEKLDLRQIFIAQAMQMNIEKGEYEQVLKWSECRVFVEKQSWTKVAAWITTLISSATIIAGIVNPAFFQLFIPIVLINLSILSPFFNRTNHYQAAISKKHSFLKTYAVLLNLLAGEDFTHPDLVEIKQQCKNGSIAIRELSAILDLFDQRLNILVGFTLNALFLFDFYMLHRLAKWNRDHKKDFEDWLNISGSTDAIISLAGFAYNHPEYTYPEINSELTGINALDLGHPMIVPEKRIDNSIETQAEKVILITGANMAGKSTFLRAVGVNMVLTYAGCPVCAKRLQTGYFKLYSSMRTSDSLKDDESYFFAEIKRLKSIVEKMEAGEKMLILLDEVLKGTNTTDKQKGSRGLIEKSIRYNVLCFIATHDLALGELEEKHPEKVKNYCFESYINDLELTFDYKITPGLAKNMNASFLMKKMGIVEG